MIGFGDLDVFLWEITRILTMHLCWVLENYKCNPGFIREKTSLLSIYIYSNIIRYVFGYGIQTRNLAVSDLNPRPVYY